MEREKGHGLVVCRRAEPVAVTPTEGGEDVKCSPSPKGVIYKEGKTLSLETTLVPYYCDSTSRPRARWPWTWTSQLHPSPPSPGNTHSHSLLHNRGHQKRTPQRDRRVSCCLRNFLQAARGTLHKKASLRVTVQQPESKPPLETHRINFLSPGF